MVLKTFLLLIIDSLQNDIFIKDLRLKTFSSTGDKTRRLCGSGGGEKGETGYLSADATFVALWMNTNTLHRSRNIV